MLPDRFRLRNSAEFAHVIRRGKKIARPSLVMYASLGEPKLGLVVGKSVGGAVVRNRVKRRIRHLVAPLLTGCAMTVVVRALPKAANEQGTLPNDIHIAWSACKKALQ